MNSFWPGVTTTNTALWTQQWTQYGTCTKAIGTIGGDELKYFNTTITLYGGNDIQKALSKKAIVPDGSKKYSYQQISDAIKEMYGQAPILGCLSKGGSQLLYNVVMCYSPSLQLTACTEKHVVNDDAFTACAQDAPMLLSFPTTGTKGMLRGGEGDGIMVTE